MEGGRPVFSASYWGGAGLVGFLGGFVAIGYGSVGPGLAMIVVGG